jgi:hypothetical protein
MSMSELTTCLQYHSQHRAVNCCVCGRRWDEQWVSVALLDDAHSIGPLCPCCLCRRPQEAAMPLRAYGALLQAILGDVHEAVTPRAGAASTRDSTRDLLAMQGFAEDHLRLLVPVAARFKALRRESDRLCAATKLLLEKSVELRQRTAALRAELVQSEANSRRLIETSRRMRQQTVDMGQLDLLESVDELELGAVVAEAFLDLAARFPHGPAWPTTVHEVIYAERRCFRARLLDPSPQLLRRAVDDRYQRFIKECA